MGAACILRVSKQFSLAKAELYGDHASAMKILSCHNPMQCLQLGKQVVGFRQNPTVWYNQAKKIVQNITFSKFQATHLKFDLLATEESFLAESTLGDYWGIGLSHKSPNLCDPSRWTGRNVFGGILMATRQSLKHKSQNLFKPTPVSPREGDILLVGDSNVGRLKQYCSSKNSSSSNTLPTNLHYLSLSGHPIEGILNWVQYQICHKRPLPQKLIIQCGTVNVLRRQPLNVIAASLTFLLNFLKIHAPSMQVSFVSIPFLSNYHANQFIRQFNSTAKIICGLFGTVFINTYSAFSQNGRFLASSLQKDGIHLSADGCHRCAKIIKDHACPSSN